VFGENEPLPDALKEDEEQTAVAQYKTVQTDHGNYRTNYCFPAKGVMKIQENLMKG